MLYELRTYVIPAGRMDDILERFRTVTFRLFEKYDMEVEGESKARAQCRFSLSAIFD